MAGIVWFYGGTVDCTCYRLLRNEENRLEEALLMAEPRDRHFLRVDLKHVKEALVIIKQRNTKE